MKLFKRILVGLALFLGLSLLGGYIYFQLKFSPPKNTLNVEGKVENLIFHWKGDEFNPYQALLIPIQLKEFHRIFYMQLDTGSPYTLFYKNPLESLTEIQDIDFTQESIELEFNIGDLSVSSSNFPLISYGKSYDDVGDSILIVGTIGTDLLEKRILDLDFRNQSISFIESTTEDSFKAFEFKKRKILFPGILNGKSQKFLYDSGTSGFELITHQVEWERLRNPQSPIRKEKGNSWGKTLQVITADTDSSIEFASKKLPLKEVTYIQGTSAFQNFLMKSSGMSGMIGNKIFLNHRLIVDAKNKRYKIE